MPQNPVMQPQCPVQDSQSGPPCAPLTALTLLARPARLAEAAAVVAVAEPPVTALAALPAACPVLALCAGWRRHMVKHCPDTPTPQTLAPAAGTSPPASGGKTSPKQDQFVPEPVSQCYRHTATHPAHRPVPSTLQGKRRALWLGHTSHHSGRGSAGGSCSRRNPVGTLREHQAKHPRQNTASKATPGSARLPEQ